MIDKMKLNKSADKKPSTQNPLTNFSANKMIMALMAKRKNPNVKTVIGIVRTVSIGFTMAFKNANAIATFKAEK